MQKKILVTWDIDGTMLSFDNNVNIHHQAFTMALSEIFKPNNGPSDVLGCSIYGWMDRKIVRDVIIKLGFEGSDENVEKANKRTEEIFEELFTAIPTVPPGVERALKELSENENVTIAVASGNLEGVAWKKLKNAGLDKYFVDKLGGFGGYVYTRVDALKLARSNAEKLRGYKFDKVFHVGDMPTDVEAANAAGATAIAVKTGGIKCDKFPEPSIVFENLEVCHDEFMKVILE